MYMDDEVIIEADGSEEVGSSEEELEATSSRADFKVLKLKKELTQANKEKQEYLDGWQRSKADYVNVLKRAEAERESALAKGIAKGAKAFIAVMDTLDRAEGAGEVPDAFQAIARQLHGAATSLGLTKFGAIGEAFDHNIHEALGQDVVEEELEDTVTAVLEPGWKAGEEVIRPAKVRVGQSL